MDSTKGSEGEAASGLTRVLDTIWNGIIIADSKWNPAQSCFDLANEYAASGKTPEECARNFIKWQTAKATLAGFALGLPGLPYMAVTVPADFASAAYIQLRMVAVIALLFGWDTRSDRLRTMAFATVIGSGVGEVVRDVGVTAGETFAKAQIKKIPATFLRKLGKMVGNGRFFVKTPGAKAGVVNFAKAAPIVGGFVGGGINLIVTRQIGHAALRWLREGPSTGGTTPEAEGAVPPVENSGGPIIEGVAG